jgi:ABC-type Fe3+-hydroxamate transport system substrate-binding protein
MKYTDHMHRNIEITPPVQRIVSLVPSITELLVDLGLRQQIVGVTKFCIHPEDIRKEKQRVGGTKNPNIDAIAALQPDLILASKEENEKQHIDSLAAMFPVWVSDVKNFNDAISLINSIGMLTNTQNNADIIAQQIIGSKDNFHTYYNTVHGMRHPEKAAYLIWKNPYMTVGGDTFINAMLTMAGFANAFEAMCRYPVVTIEELNALHIKYLFLSSEPYPFHQTHVDELKRQVPGAHVILVDGEMFSWYGSRMLHCFAYFKQLYNTIYLKYNK